MSGLVEDGRKTFCGQTPVLDLAAGLIGGDTHHPVGGTLAQPPQHVLLERYRYRRRPAKIKTNLGPGVGTIGVLAARTSGRTEGPRELRVGDDMIGYEHAAIVAEPPSERSDSYPIQRSVLPTPRRIDSVLSDGICLGEKAKPGRQ